MIATVRLLGRSVASWTRAGVQMEVFQRSLLFRSDIAILRLGLTVNKLSVPWSEASTAKGETAIFANSQLIRWVVGFVISLGGFRIISWPICFVDLVLLV